MAAIVIAITTVEITGLPNIYIKTFLLSLNLEGSLGFAFVICDIGKQAAAAMSLNRFLLNCRDISNRDFLPCINTLRASDVRDSSYQFFLRFILLNRWSVVLSIFLGNNLSGHLRR